MAGSGIPFIDSLFDTCVLLLVWVSGVLGLTYEEVNIYLFCVVWPLLTVYQTLRIVYLKGKVSAGCSK